MSDDRHDGKQSKGGVPTAPTIDELLELEPGPLAAFLIGAMSVGARHENFAALGNVIKAGCCANPKGRENLALALRRRGR